VFIQEGLTFKNWQKLQWFIVFHTSIWRGARNFVWGAGAKVTKAPPWRRDCLGGCTFLKCRLIFYLAKASTLLPTLPHRNVSGLLGFEHIAGNTSLFARYNSKIVLKKKAIIQVQVSSDTYMVNYIEKYKTAIWAQMNLTCVLQILFFYLCVAHILLSKDRP